MVRPLRVDIGDAPYHVINRANGRHTIFHNAGDYQDFVLYGVRPLGDKAPLGRLVGSNRRRIPF